jgi:hypothetical protein
MVSAPSTEEKLADLANQLTRLKTLYEQYFIGIEKTAPSVVRRDVERLLADLAALTIRNTALRFRYSSLLHRWKTYSERWDKVLREIEAGTWRRSRAHRRRGDEPTTETPAPVFESARVLDEAAPTAAEPAAPSIPIAVGATGPSAAPPRLPPRVPVSAQQIPGMSDAELRRLHEHYVEACRTVGDPRESVRYESLVASLRRQVPGLLEKNGCDRLEFSVRVKDGKVILKAVPQR